MTENFSTVVHLAAPAHARRVDQRVARIAVLEVEPDGVARRAGLVERDDALLAEQRVDERRLADVRTPDDGDLDATPARRRRLVVYDAGRNLDAVERDVNEVAHVLAMLGRDRKRLAEAELVEVGHRALAR